MTILEPFPEHILPATIPLFSVVQFRDDHHRATDQIGITLPNWGTKRLSNKASFAPSDIMDFALPIFHAKNPLTFQLAQSTYNESTHPKEHPFVRRILHNKYLRNNTPSFRKCGLVDVDTQKNAIPFLTFYWNENTHVYIRYHHLSSISATAGALLYQLTGQFLLRNALWRHTIM